MLLILLIAICLLLVAWYHKLMIKKLVSWTEKFAEHKYSEVILFIVAFTESSFFLVPPDVLIIAILSHHLKKSWVKVASISTVGSVLGGVFGYAIGYYFYQYIGQPIVNFYVVQAEINHVGELFKAHAFISILAAAFTPIPYKVFTIGAGLFSLNMFTFVTASVVGRGARFFIVAYLSNKYGDRAKQIILNKGDKILWIVGIVVFVIIYFLSK